MRNWEELVDDWSSDLVAKVPVAYADYCERKAGDFDDCFLSGKKLAEDIDKLISRSSI